MLAARSKPPPASWRRRVKDIHAAQIVSEYGFPIAAMPRLHCLRQFSGVEFTFVDFGRKRCRNFDRRRNQKRQKCTATDHFPLRFPNHNGTQQEQRQGNKSYSQPKMSKGLLHGMEISQSFQGCAGHTGTPTRQVCKRADRATKCGYFDRPGRRERGRKYTRHGIVLLRANWQIKR